MGLRHAATKALLEEEDAFARVLEAAQARRQQRRVIAVLAAAAALCAAAWGVWLTSR